MGLVKKIIEKIEACIGRGATVVLAILISLWFILGNSNIVEIWKVYTNFRSGAVYNIEPDDIKGFAFSLIDIISSVTIAILTVFIVKSSQKNNELQNGMIELQKQNNEFQKTLMEIQDISIKLQERSLELEKHMCAKNKESEGVETSAMLTDFYYAVKEAKEAAFPPTGEKEQFYFKEHSIENISEFKKHLKNMINEKIDILAKEDHTFKMGLQEFEKSISYKGKIETIGIDNFRRYRNKELPEGPIKEQEKYIKEEDNKLYNALDKMENFIKTQIDIVEHRYSSEIDVVENI